MRSGCTKAKVRIGITCDGKSLWFLEYILVAIGGVIEHQHFVASMKVYATKHNISGDGASHPGNRGGESNDFFDGGLVVLVKI